MARINGSVSLNSSHYVFFVDVAETSVDVPGNRSYVKASVYLRHTRWGWIDPNAYSGSVTINGSTKSFTYKPNFSYDSSGDALLTTYELWVAHNSDGSKTVSVSASYSSKGTYSPGNCSASGSVPLTKIDRVAPTVSVSASSITESSFKLSLYANTTCDVWRYSINNGASYTNISASAGTSATVTVSASPNTTYNIKAQARKKTNQIYGTSGTLTVKTLGGAKLNSVKSVSIDSNLQLSCNVTVYNATYTHELTLMNGNAVLASFSNLKWAAGTSDRILQLNESQRLAILNAMPDTASKNFTYQLKTFNGSSQMGNTSTSQGAFTVSAAGSGPYFEDSEGFVYQDINPTTVNMTENSELFVQGQSVLQVTVSNAIARNGASLVKYVCSIGGLAKSQQETIFNMGTVFDSGSVTVRVYAQDSRGFQVTVTKQIQVFSYTPVQTEKINFRRINEVEAQLNFSFSGRFSSVRVEDTEKNTIVESAVRYKKVSDNAFSKWESFEVNVSDTHFDFQQSPFGNFDPDFSWNLQLKISDKITTDIIEITIPPGIPLLSYRSKKVGINNPNPQEALDVSGNIKVSGNVKSAQMITENIKSSMVKANDIGILVAANENMDYITGETASLELQPNVQLNAVGELSNAVRAGNIVTVNFGFKVTAAFNAYQVLAYIPEHLRNKSHFVRFTIWINSTPALGNVYGNGGINAAVSIPANAIVFGYFSYPISV